MSKPLGRPRPGFQQAAAGPAADQPAALAASLTPLYVEARRTGVLRLANRGLESVPPRVTCLLDESAMTEGEKWWEAVPLKSLDLTNNEIAALPEDLGRLGDALVTLTAARNAIEALPASVGDLVSLASLDLSRNRLRELPEEIGRLGELRTLKVGGNAIRALPESLGGLARLERLDASDNQIGALSRGMGGMRSLRFLSVAGNRLREFPDAVARGCVGLERLEVGRNSLAALPDLSGLPRLAVLDATQNQLCDLPRLPTGGAMRELMISNNRVSSLAGLDAVAGLATIVARANRISDVPAEIATLPLKIVDLANNSLDDVPSELGTVLSLHKLVLDGNFLGKIRRGVADQSITVVKAYLRERLGLPATVDLDELEGEARATEVAVRDAESGGMRLTLSGLGLSTIGGRVFDVPLVSVDASKNKLRELPEGFLQLGASLQTLVLDANRLAALGPGPVVGGLTRLSDLRLRKNGLTDVPAELASLPNLRHLDLRNNRFEALSENVTSLSQVHTLLLGFNALRELPGDRLAGLASLTELDLGDNKLGSLPPSVRGLRELRTLNLQNNELSRLPLELAVMPALVALAATGNPMRQINASVVAGGSQAIKDALRKKIPIDSPLLQADEDDAKESAAAPAIDYSTRDALQDAIDALNDELQDFGLSGAKKFAIKKDIAKKKADLIRENRRLKALEDEQGRQ